MDDHIERLERLEALHARGALTDSEYEAAKAQVLGADEPGDTVRANWDEPTRTSIPEAGAAAQQPDTQPAGPGSVSPPVLPAGTWAGAYTTGPFALPAMGETRDDLRRRGIFFKRYPPWVMVLLTVFTLGIYMQFWLNHWHGIMPKRRTDDPGTGRAIGFLFIPFFNYYWVFESVLRLCTRLDEEFAEAGLATRCPRELIRWTVISNVVPYINYLGLLLPVLPAIVVGQMQSRVNQLADYDQRWFAEPQPAPAAAPGY